MDRKEHLEEFIDLLEDVIMDIEDLKFDAEGVTINNRLNIASDELNKVRKSYEYKLKMAYKGVYF